MAELELIIADKTISSWSLRPWLAMKQAGVVFRERTILLGRPTTKEEIRAYSPSGWIPCLLVDGRPIWDSLAICEFIAEAAPEAGLWPEDRMARAVARSVTAEMHSGFRSFPGSLRMDVNASLATPVIEGPLKTDIARIQRIWQGCREEFGGEGPYLFGRFSIADAFFAPAVSRFQTYAIPCEGLAGDYMRSILDLPAMLDWKAQARAEASAG